MVNTARALKYLEDFRQRQSQLVTILEKYHFVPDNLENLQSQFHFLKEATSRNIENLQQAITVLQTYAANLCTYTNNILPRITKLEDTIHKLQQKLTTEQDTIQINAPDFDLDIDGPNIPRAHNNTVAVSVQEWLTLSEPELSDATNFQEETTDRDPPNSTYNNSEESHGHDNFFQHVSNHTPVQHSMGQHQNHPTPHTIIQRNPMGMTISSSTFQTIHQYSNLWDNTRTLQEKTSIQKKFPTRRGLGQQPIC